MMVALSERFEDEQAAIEFNRLVFELEGRLDHLADEGLEAIRGRAPRRIRGDGSIWEQLRECIRGTVRTEWAAFRDGTLPGRLPDIDGTLIVIASRIGDLDFLLAGYRFAQIALWGSWFELIEASEAEDPVKQELLRDGSRYFFQYAELVSRYIAEGYQRGVGREGPDDGGRRIRELAPQLGADALADAHLEVELNRFHLGLIAWGEGADEQARSLASEVDRRLLLIERIEHGWWGWLSGSRRLEPCQWQQLHRFHPREGVRIAFGLDGYGEAGFRATHHQALRARSFVNDHPKMSVDDHRKMQVGLPV